MKQTYMGYSLSRLCDDFGYHIAAIGWIALRDNAAGFVFIMRFDLEPMNIGPIVLQIQMGFMKLNEVTNLFRAPLRIGELPEDIV